MQNMIQLHTFIFFVLNVFYVLIYESLFILGGGEIFATVLIMHRLNQETKRYQ